MKRFFNIKLVMETGCDIFCFKVTTPLTHEIYNTTQPAKERHHDDTTSAILIQNLEQCSEC